MRRSAKVAVFGGILFVGSLLVSLGGTVLGMMGGFNSLATSGEASEEQLAETLGNSLTLTGLLLPVAFVGLCLLAGGIIAYFAGRGKETPEERPG